MQRLAICTLLLLVPGAAAAYTPLLADPAGDVDSSPDTGPAGDRWRHADLLVLETDETATMFRFRLQHTPPVEAGEVFEDARYTVAFRFGTVVYEARVQAYTVLSDRTATFYSASLYRRAGPDESLRNIGSLQAAGDAQDGTITVDVPHHLVTDRHDVEAHAGAALTDVHATAAVTWLFSPTSGGEAIGGTDRMPDDGTGLLPVRFGAAQTGHLRLATDERIRASNGEATTYLWRVNATNLDLEDDEATLTLTGVPSSWEVRLPFHRVLLPGNASTDLPVLATVPFQHQHGASQAFVVEARSVSDPTAVGRLELGVEFVDVPQPAGHHDTVFLHAHGGASGLSVSLSGIQAGFIGGNAGYMNTDPDDVRDDEVPVRARGGGNTDSLDRRYGWVVPLDPALRLGLDFDLTRTGTLDVAYDAPQGLDGARLSGHLLLVPRDAYATDPDDYEGFPGVTVLADLPASEPATVGRGASQAVGLSVVPRPEADLVARDPEQNVVLLLRLEGTAPPPVLADDAPHLLPGGVLRLPLFEYHDPIDASFAAPEFIHLDLRGPAERFVAPGGAVLYNMTLRNDGTRDGTFRVEITGTNTAWARLPLGKTVQAMANRTAALAVAVSPPADARQGDVADLIVEAVNVADPRMRGLVRIVATVDGERAVTDDTAEVVRLEEEARRGTPMPPVGLVIALVVMGAAVASRRRDGLP